MPGIIATHLLLAFIGAVTLLMLIPGPNVALITANSLAHGARYGLLTVAGTTAAMAVQLALVAAGMTGLLGGMGQWFSWIRWIGAAYLLYLGVTQWRAIPPDFNQVKPAKAQHLIFAQAMLVSLTNPKTLLFLAALFPQFVAEPSNLFHQFTILSVVFLIIAIVIDSGWALLAARLRGILARRSRLRQRLTGGILIGAAFGLAGIRDR